MAEFRVPADSPKLIESKSFKLYLGSLAQHRIASSDALRALLAGDLSHAAGAPVSVVLSPVTSTELQFAALAGEVIDDLPCAIEHYGPPRPQLVQHDTETDRKSGL